MKKKRGIYLAVFLAVLCINFASADFQLGDSSYSIASEYIGGKGIIGWINISFDNEPNNSLFNDSFGNSMTLLELLNENSNFIYNLTGGNISNSSFQKLYLENGSFFTPETPGNYSYQLNLSNMEIFSREIFVINEESKDVNATLQAKIKNLNSIKTTIAGFDSFVQGILNETLKINETENKIKKLRIAYESSTAGDEEILANLSNITIPESIYISKSSDGLTFFSNESDINLDVLKSIGTGTYEAGNESKYINSILIWNQENIETRVNVTEISAIYNGSNEVLIRLFYVEINKKTDLNYSLIFIIEKLAGMKFKGDYGENESGNYFYIKIPVESGKTLIGFSTTEEIEFLDLPMFISLPLSKLVLSEGGYEEFSGEDTEKISKWILFLLIIVLLIIIGIITYVALQAWYKKRYEKYLFKNKNELYNLATYITTSKAKGLDNNQISENLRKARWSSEQIRYAMRKYIGKNTGMLEIPVKKMPEKKEKMQ